jgi:hypothetical protein
MNILDRIADNLELLPEIIEEYETLIDEEEVAKRLRIKGKVLETANTEQSGWQYYYETRKAEVHSLVKWLEAKLAAVRGKHFKKYTEHYSRELSDRQKDKYIDNEKEVLAQLEVYLQAKELYEKYEAVCDAFKSRGFALRNITEIRIRSLEDTII